MTPSPEVQRERHAKGQCPNCGAQLDWTGFAGFSGWVGIACNGVEGQHFMAKDSDINRHDAILKVESGTRFVAVPVGDDLPDMQIGVKWKVKT